MSVKSASPQHMGAQILAGCIGIICGYLIAGTPILDRMIFSSVNADDIKHRVPSSKSSMNRISTPSDREPHVSLDSVYRKLQYGEEIDVGEWRAVFANWRDWRFDDDFVSQFKRYLAELSPETALSILELFYADESAFSRFVESALIESMPAQLYTAQFLTGPALERMSRGGRVSAIVRLSQNDTPYAIDCSVRHLDGWLRWQAIRTSLENLSSNPDPADAMRSILGVSYDSAVDKRLIDAICIDPPSDIPTLNVLIDSNRIPAEGKKNAIRDVIWTMAHSNPSTALELANKYFPGRERNDVLKNIASHAATDNVQNSFVIADEIVGRQGREATVRSILASDSISSEPWVKRWDIANSIQIPDLRMTALRITFSDFERQDKASAHAFVRTKASDPMVQFLLNGANQ